MPNPIKSFSSGHDGCTPNFTVEELSKRVHESLDQGLKDGYDNLVTDLAIDVAVDLGSYDNGLEDVVVSDLFPHVQAWQVKQLEKTQAYDSSRDSAL